MRDIVERTYRCYFHVQYKNQSNGSKNQVIFKLQQEFLEQCSMRPMGLVITKKKHLKSIISKHIFLQCVHTNPKITKFIFFLYLI